MARAVRIIEPDLPQILARERVELRPARTLRKDGAGERDMALEDAGEALAHLGRRLADRDGARHVGRAVLILAARIDEEERAQLQLAIGLLAHPVMDDRAVRARARNSVEGQILERT